MPDERTNPDPIGGGDEADEPSMFEPTDAERRGYGDIGQFGDPDPAAAGGDQTYADTDAIERLEQGDLGASPPTGTDAINDAAAAGGIEPADEET